MRHLLLILLIFSIAVLAQEQDKGGDAMSQEQGWDVVSELPYSYAYTRTYLGYQMRRKGWKCILGFTSGHGGRIEHSLWEKDGLHRQLMLWRVDTGCTGYSWKDIQEKKVAENACKREYEP